MDVARARPAGAPATAAVEPSPPPAVDTATRPVPLPATLALLGAGRAGTSVAAALSRAGVRPVAVTARSAASRARAAALLPSARRRGPLEAARAAELVVLGVPDDALPGLVQQVADGGGWRPGAVVVHLSGAGGRSVLAPAAATGATTLALHPATTFSGTAADAARLAGAAVGVDADAAGSALAHALVHALGGWPVPVPEEARAAYHAALVHGSNHLGTLVVDAVDALRAAGVPEPAEVLAPLARAALARALDEGAVGLTGPVVRGDARTVARHVRALQDVAPAALGTYRCLAGRTAALAQESGRLSAVSGEAIRCALAQEEAA